MTLTLSEGGTSDRMEIASQDKRLDNIEIPIVEVFNGAPQCESNLHLA